MPGNEVNDRVHNFFEQGGLSQDQRRTQLVEGNWPVFNNNLWGGSERQVSGPLTSGPKNYSAQQSDSDREKVNQFSSGTYGLNSAQSNLRPEFVKNPTHPQQLNLNGFMHASQFNHTRQNEANFLGLDAEHDRHSLTSRGRSVLDSQQRSGSPHTHSASFGSSDSPMNFNFLGGQQQMSSQQPGMLQSMPRQQFAVNDGQVLQQQVMMKQMQELQRQRQFQQLDAMQRNVVNQIPTVPNQMVGPHSLAINGNPMYDTSNYPWSSQVMAANINWSQRGFSPSIQGFSNGLMVTPEQGQALRLMGLTQQGSQSLYGVPVSGSNNINTLSANSLDKSGGVLQESAPSNSFSSNTQYAPLPEQMSVQGGTTVSKPGSEGKSLFDHRSSQGSENLVSFGSFNQMQQKNVTMSECGRQNLTNGSGLVPEKSATLDTTKQADVGLDPTEEKILFGNDESIWEAFGGASVMGTGAVNRPEGSNLLNGPSLLQSGTWSALMQSAVAETSSSNDIGMQEEWSGLGHQNTSSQSGNAQSLFCQDNLKEQPVWVDRSQRVSLDSQHATNNMNSDYVSSSGLQQPFASQTRQSLSTEHQISQEGGKWLDVSQPVQQTEKSWSLENANPSRESPKTDIGFLSNQHSRYLHNNNSQSSGKLSALNFIESAPENKTMISANRNDVLGKEHHGHMPMDTSARAVVGANSISDYNVDVGNLCTSGDAAASSLGNMINHGSDQNFQDNRQVDFWKSVNSSVQYGIVDSRKQRHNLGKGPPILDSSVSVPDGRAAEIHETENGDVGQNSSDSHRSNFQHPVTAGGSRANAWSNAGDRQSLPGEKENQSEQAGKQVPVTRKFQYHPMGDVDMDVDSSTYASKQILHSQAMPQHLSSGVRVHEMQARFLGQSSINSKDLQGRVFSQGAPRVSDRGPSSGIHPGHFVNSSEIFSQNQNLPQSQNMLELLHKVDQSEEQAAARSGQSQSSTSHGFNFQLAPPSQAIASSHVNITSQSSSRTVDFPSSGFATFVKGDKGHAWSASASSAQNLSHPSPQTGTENDKSGVSGNMDVDGSLQNQMGNVSAPLPSGSSYLRNPLQQHHVVAESRKMILNQSSVPFESHAFLDRPMSDPEDQATVRQSVSNSLNNLASGGGMNRLGLRASMQQLPMSSPDFVPGMSRNDILSPLGKKMWSQHQLLGAHARNAAELLKSQSQPNDASGANSFTNQQAYEQDCRRRVDAVSSQGIVGQEEPMVSEPIVKHPSNASPSNSAASQKDFEAFHYSGKPSSTAPSMLHQTQPMKSTVADQSLHITRRLKETDITPAAQEISGNVEQTRSDTQRFATGNDTARVEHSGISPQMAPSWFQQYGTSKNGQSLSLHNLPRLPMANNFNQQFISGKSPYNLDGCESMQSANVTTEPVHFTNGCQTANASAPSDHVSSLDALVPHVSSQTLAPITPKKRKTATSDLLSWYKEIGQGFRRLQNISMAEVDWAKSSNRVVEKVEDETDAYEEIWRMNRPKRRLTLTTQLMQQAFRSPLPAVLSLVASSNYEIIVYSLARLTVGDTCSLVSCSESDSSADCDSSDLVNGKVKTSDTMRNQYFSKIVEDFTSRATELENLLSRLDKRASILDFRLDLQDLERFSVINRFARFHGRSQVDGAESSSSSSDPTLVIQRPFPQRYVSAHPMPRNIPDRAQCLSL